MPCPRGEGHAGFYEYRLAHVAADRRARRTPDVRITRSLRTAEAVGAFSGSRLSGAAAMATWPNPSPTLRPLHAWALGDQTAEHGYTWNLELPTRV